MTGNSRARRGESAGESATEMMTDTSDSTSPFAPRVCAQRLRPLTEVPNPSSSYEELLAFEHRDLGDLSDLDLEIERVESLRRGCDNANDDRRWWLAHVEHIDAEMEKRLTAQLESEVIGFRWGELPVNTAGSRTNRPSRRGRETRVRTARLRTRRVA